MAFRFRPRIMQRRPVFVRRIRPRPIKPAVVVVQQPKQQQQQQQNLVRGQADWSTGLCACMDDCGICLCVTCCTPCAACELASEMEETICITCFVPNWLTILRTKLRVQQGIEGTVCDDCCVTYFCAPMAMCQMMREIDLAQDNGETD